MIASLQLETILTYLLFFGIPALALLFFGISLFRFCYAKYKNKHVPGTFSDEAVRTRKIVFIVSAVIAGILAAVIIGFVILLFMAVAFM